MTGRTRRLPDNPGARCAPDEVTAARDAVDRVYAARARAGSLGPDGSMHLLTAVANCPELAFLIDHPATFSHVWSILGWNIHVYHSRLDVHPPIRVPVPFRFEWHQDGGRQNREIETNPRPRLSVKLAYWLSDVRARLRQPEGRARQPRGELSCPAEFRMRILTVPSNTSAVPETGRSRTRRASPN